MVLAIALVCGTVVLAKNINGGPGYQVLSGTPGNDVIQARDGGPDTIDCGAGNDTVYVDRSEDGVVDCETVITP
jgi:Ca2+-binding RTX toxin-like protein